MQFPYCICNQPWGRKDRFYGLKKKLFSGRLQSYLWLEDKIEYRFGCLNSNSNNVFLKKKKTMDGIFVL